MDIALKRLCNQDIIVYPCLGYVDGDKQLGTPFSCKCYSAAKIRILWQGSVQEVTSDTEVYLDGDLASRIHKGDTVELPLIGKRPILHLQTFPKLTSPDPELLLLYL